MAASSFAALALILTEKGIPDPFPIQDGVGRIAQAFDGDAQVGEIFQITLDGQPHDLGPRAAQGPRRVIERGDDVFGQAGGDLAHGSHWDSAKVNGVTIAPANGAGHGARCGVKTSCPRWA